MKQVINEKLINRNKKIGNITSIVGIAILVAGLILNIKPTPSRTLISLGALVVGFIIAQISTYYVARFSRSPRYDEIIADNLSKLNNQYTFYVYKSPVPMLLVGPKGIWVPSTISASGEIYYDKKWRQRGGSFLLKMFGQENIGRPEMDIRNNEKAIVDFLSGLLDKNEIPPVRSILVSMHPKSTIGDIENAPIPIVVPDSVRRNIRKIDRKIEVEIDQETQGKINEALANYR